MYIEFDDGDVNKPLRLRKEGDVTLDNYLKTHNRRFRFEIIA